jgi:hypothetical protein
MSRDPSIPTRIFRLVTTILREDPALRLWVDRIVSYSERDDAGRQPTGRGRGELRVFPFITSQRPESPDSHEIRLEIRATLIFEQAAGSDYLDAWFAVERALYPRDLASRLVLAERLRTQGATTGEAMFAPPQPDAQAPRNEGQLAVTGRILFDCRFNLNP